MLLLAVGLSDQVKAWQEIFGGGPLAAFLGLMILAVISIFGLYVRANGKLLKEKDDHAATIRTVTELAGAMERTWGENLRKDFEHLQSADKAAELQKQTLDVLTRSVAMSEWFKSQAAAPRAP